MFDPRTRHQFLFSKCIKMTLVLTDVEIYDGDDLYLLLGIKQRDATADDITKAFRKIASSQHPDKGGDPALFCKILKAYKILSDPKMRAEYDELGQIPIEESVLEEKANAKIEITLTQICDHLAKANTDLLNVSVITMAYNHFSAEQRNLNSGLNIVELAKRNYTFLVKKLRNKKSRNAITNVLNERIKACSAEIVRLNNEARIIEYALKNLDNYEG